MTTVTTVGYGDAIPVTPAGRAFAVVLMLIGVGLFGLPRMAKGIPSTGRFSNDSNASSAHLRNEIKGSGFAADPVRAPIEPMRIRLNNLEVGEADLGTVEIWRIGSDAHAR